MSLVATFRILLAIILLAIVVECESDAQFSCGRSDIGDRLLYYCLGGQGPITVVFEAGMQSDSRTWRLVAPQVASLARVLIYDRAGLGNSDPGPAPRTSLQIVRELHQLLKTLGVSGQLLLVGHSAGGLHMRVFASEFPERVIGMVLVDSPHETFNRRREALFSEEERAERSAMLENLRAELPEGTRLEYEGLDANPEELWRRPLPDRPLIVLSADQHDWVPLKKAPAQEMVWQELQARLAKLTKHGRLQIVHGSGHNIQLQRPEAIIQAIQHIISEANGK